MLRCTADATKSRVYLSLSTMLDLRIIQRVLGTGAAEPIRNLFTTFGKNVLKLVAVG